jgi:hypothetical protein
MMKKNFFVKNFGIALRPLKHKYIIQSLSELSGIDCDVIL